MGAAAAVVLAASWLGYEYLTVGRFVVTTDDAYVRAYNTTLGAKVAGYVSEFLVEDNTRVRAGDVIALLRPADVTLSLEAPTGSARNVFDGPVSWIAVDGELARVRVGSKPPLVAEVTLGSVERLGLREGVRAWASFKAVEVRVLPR